MDFHRELGAFLGSLRERKRISQDALGQQLSLGQSDVSKIETGHKRVTVALLVAWCNALGERPPEVLKVFLESMEGMQPKGLWERTDD